jgi:hypothetical protein
MSEKWRLGLLSLCCSLSFSCDRPSHHHASCTAIAYYREGIPEWCDPKRDPNGKTVCHRCLFAFRENGRHTSSRELIYASAEEAEEAARGFECKDLSRGTHAVTAYCPASRRFRIDPGTGPPLLH